MSKLFDLDKKMLDSFPAKIEYVRRGSIGVPKTIEIDLAIALTDQIYNLAGNIFYIWEAPNSTDYINIKVNNSREPAIPYRPHTGLITPFDKLLITTPAAQVGTMTLIYATEAPDLLQIIDHRSAMSGNLTAILEQLAGDVAPENWGNEITVGNAAGVLVLAANADRKGCCLQAKSTNGGIIYLGFDDTVTTTKWIAELQAGVPFTIDDYRGDIYARASAVGQLVGWGEW